MIKSIGERFTRQFIFMIQLVANWKFNDIIKKSFLNSSFGHSVQYNLDQSSAKRSSNTTNYDSVWLELRNANPNDEASVEFKFFKHYFESQGIIGYQYYQIFGDYIMPA